jgi:surface carbohydrate biosynthesis protein
LARIYINIEIQKREFDGRFLLALMAAERGHTVILGYLKPLLRDGLLSPGIVLDKSLTPRPEKLSLMKGLKDRGFLVTSIDEESGLLGADYAPFAVQRYSEQSLGLADAVFFWGPFDHAYMKQAYPQFADRFHVTGNPRVDMWRPEMAAFFGNAAPNPRPYVLLPSNFSSIFGRDDLHVSIRRLRRMGYVKEGSIEDPWEARTYQFYHEGVLLGWEFIKSFRRLARRFPEADFIVRPHPTEAPQRWQDLLQPQGNLLIRSEGSISPWIRHARGVVNHGCTSALESALCGAPLIGYEATENSNPDLAFSKQLGEPAHSYEELENLVGRMLQGEHKSTTEADLRVLGTRLAALSGPFASERMVDIWDKLDNETLRRGGLWADGSGSRLSLLPHRVDAYTFMSRFGVKNKNWGSWKIPPFNLRSVLDIKSLFSRSLGRFQDLPVNILGPRILKIG